MAECPIGGRTSRTVFSKSAIWETITKFAANWKHVVSAGTARHVSSVGFVESWWDWKKGESMHGMKDLITLGLH